MARRYMRRCPAGLLLALMLTGAVPCVASRADAGSRITGWPPGTWRVEVPASLDSLFRLAASDAGLVLDTAAPRSRMEIEAIAARLRDRLAAGGRWDQVVRLTYHERSASPGLARLAIGDSQGYPAAGRGRALDVRVVGAEDVLPDANARFFEALGGAMTPAAIAGGLAALRDALLERGHLEGSARVDSLWPEGHRLCLAVRVDPGPAIRVEALELPGATATRPTAAAAISGLKRGTPVTPRRLEAAEARLRASELFTTVGTARVLPGIEPGGARISIPVEESRASRFEGAVGVAQGNGLAGVLDLALGNIGGSGRAAGARWVGLGAGRAQYALRYREPALLRKPIDAVLGLEGDIIDSLFTETRWAIAVGGAVAPRARAAGSLKRSASAYARGTGGTSATTSLGGSVGWASLAPHGNPTHGLGLDLKLEAGRRVDRYPGLPEARRLMRSASITLEGAFGLGGRRVLYARTHGEEVRHGSDAVPVEALRYVGGDEWLRGHPGRAFAGNRVWALTLEHRWLRGPSGGRVYLFGDAAGRAMSGPLTVGGGAGSGAALSRTVLSPGVSFGYGAGLSAGAGGGLLGLEIGLRPGASLGRATLHLRYASRF